MAGTEARALELEELSDARRPWGIEVVLREKTDAKIVHLVNMDVGEREVFEASGRRYVKITSLGSVPECRVSVRMSKRPTRVVFEPQGKTLEKWEYADGRVEFNVPSFLVHQMVVLED